jgi:hypothetical protein
MDNPDGFTIDDELAYEPLRNKGWHVETVSWRANVDWDYYNLVIIRSPWDYQNAPDDFIKVLTKINSSNAALQNPLSLVRWNLDKRYLRDLEHRGIPIVPTLWGTNVHDFTEMDFWFNRLGAQELIVKPVISANADHTYRLPVDAPESLKTTLRNVFYDRPFMVQPFVPSVIEEGEFSLFYFSGDFSHAILKTPKADDFRVQEEHGGFIRGVQPSPELRRQADAAMLVLPAAPLYARVDFVRLPKEGNNEHYVVMEFELIEPALYLRMDEGAAERFACAVNELDTFDVWMSHHY